MNSKSFYDQSVKNKYEAYAKIVEMSRKITTVKLVRLLDTIRIVIKLLVQIYQNKQLYTFLNKFIS